jgi:hypothetical protein
MQPNDFFPLQTKLWPLIAFFVALLIGFHLVLVFWLKLGKVAWKRVDYIVSAI